MTVNFAFWPTLALAVVILSWIAFGIAFFARRKPPSAPDIKREPSSIPGIVLQGLSYALVWSIQRTHFTPILPLGKAFEIASAIVTMILSLGSLWLCMAAIRTLGKQWSLAARLVEGHKLVTEGPYSIVRNPIYTGMLGKLLATGLAISHWSGLLLAVVVFAIGTAIRVRTEEKLLRGEFGSEFEEYARAVPSVIPFLF
jgi:protein-S-isoprenylcysteine O-methyltransferase Ste14